MSDSRPITRSRLAKAKEEINKAKCDGHPLSEKEIVAKWINLKAYEEAQKILNGLSIEEHWVHCKKGQIEIRTKRFVEAFRCFQKSFTFKRNGCIQCLEQLINLMQGSKSSRDIIEQLIGIAGQRQQLPGCIRQKIQVKKHEITPKYKVSGQLDQVFHHMLSYYEQAGAKFKKLEVKEIEKDFRIAVAKKVIKPHQTIISIPERLIITLEKVKKDPQIRLLYINDSRLKSPKHCMLSVYLLNQIELGDQSQYKEYIKCLPKQIKNFPLKYPKSLLAQLQGTSFLESLMNRKEDIQEDYNTIKSILGQKSHITYDKFVWARMLVSSRIFGIVVHGVKTDALVPIADMLNHKIPKMTTWSFCDEKNSFMVQNLDEMIYQGEEIFDSYGSKCNSRFLLNYGFVQPNNLSNQVYVKFVPYKNKKPAPYYRLTLQLMSEQFRHILSFYRKAAEEENSQQKKYRYGLNITDYQYFISDENELEVWKHMKLSFKQRMAEYSTSIKHDEKILTQDETISFNKRNCVQIRLGEKKIIDYYLKMSKKMIDYFSKKRQVEINEIIYEPYLTEVSGQKKLLQTN